MHQLHYCYTCISISHLIFDKWFQFDILLNILFYCINYKDNILTKELISNIINYSYRFIIWISKIFICKCNHYFLIKISYKLQTSPKRLDYLKEKLIHASERHINLLDNRSVTKKKINDTLFKCLSIISEKPKWPTSDTDCDPAPSNCKPLYSTPSLLLIEHHPES